MAAVGDTSLPSATTVPKCLLDFMDFQLLPTLSSCVFLARMSERVAFIVPASLAVAVGERDGEREDVDCQSDVAEPKSAGLSVRRSVRGSR